MRNQSNMLCVVSATASAMMLVGCGGSSKSTAVTPAPSNAPPTAAVTPAPSVAAAPGAAMFKVLAGKARGAMDIEMFMPAEIRIRQGDTIELAGMAGVINVR